MRRLLRQLSAMETDLNDRSKPHAGPAETDLLALIRDLVRYRQPNHGRSVVEILITVVPFVLLWLSMWLSLHIGYGLYLLLAVPTPGFLVRLFMIQRPIFGSAGIASAAVER